MPQQKKNKHQRAFKFKAARNRGSTRVETLGYPKLQESNKSNKLQEGKMDNVDVVDTTYTICKQNDINECLTTTDGDDNGSEYDRNFTSNLATNGILVENQYQSRHIGRVIVYDSSKKVSDRVKIWENFFKERAKYNNYDYHTQNKSRSKEAQQDESSKQKVIYKASSNFGTKHVATCDKGRKRSFEMAPLWKRRGYGSTEERNDTEGRRNKKIKPIVNEETAA